MLSAHLIDAVRRNDVMRIDKILQGHRFNSFRRNVTEEVLKIVGCHEPNLYPDLMIQTLVCGGMLPSQLLEYACIDGNLNLVMHLITHSPDILVPSFNTGLSQAAKNNHPFVVEWLLHNTLANPMFGLIMAASKGFVHIVELILRISRHQASIELADVMYYAVYYGHLCVVQSLIGHGYRDFPVITYASAKRGHDKILVWLLNHHPPDDIQSVLHAAIESLSVNTLNIVLDFGACIDEKTAGLLTAYPASCQISVEILLHRPACILVYSQYVDAVIKAINQFKDVTSAIRLVHNRVVDTSEFRVAFTLTNIRWLMLGKIINFPGYEEMAVEVKQRLCDEADSLEQYLPTVLAHLVIMYA